MVNKKRKKRKSKSSLVALAIGLLALINFCIALIFFESDIRRFSAPEKAVTLPDSTLTTTPAKSATPIKPLTSQSFESSNSEERANTHAPLKQKSGKQKSGTQKLGKQEQSKHVGRQKAPSVKEVLLVEKQEHQPPIKSPPQGYLAIIIDDIGYRYSDSIRAIRLSPNITAAILPFTPHAQDIARQAQQLGVEIMLHAPMEPDHSRHWGEGLNSKMNKREVNKRLNAMIQNIPNIKGINNHMGSGLTQKLKTMNWVMSVLKKHKLYFIDSLTTPHSKASQAAKKYKIPIYKRDVFLDNTKNYNDIDRQFKQAIRIARHNGHALAIGHPYAETLSYLEKNLDLLEKNNIKLISVSDFLSKTSHIKY